MGLRVTDGGADNRVRGGDAMRRGHLAIEIRGRGNVIDVGPGLRASDGAAIRIDGDANRIVLGAGVSLNGNSEIRVLGAENRVMIGARCGGNMHVAVHTSGARFEMGEGCTMVGARFVLHEPARMRLGDDCMLSALVVLTVSDMHAIVDLDTGARINLADDVRLGDHVWLGARAMVLKGVDIGDGSIIGAGAVVTRSIPESCMAVGVPARVVRRRVSWDRRLFALAARARSAVDIGRAPRT